MATNWIVPTTFDLAKIISEAVLARANENTDQASLTATEAMAWGDASYRAAFDPTLEDRQADQIDLAVKQFRGAIQIAGKQPLSLTAGSVPPDACYKHCITLAAYGVISSTLNLQWVVATEKGDASPLTAAFREANKYLEAVTRGRVVVPPTDPTGRDYINPVNVPWPGIASGPCFDPNFLIPNANCLPPGVNPCVSPFPPFNAALPINPPVEPVRLGAGNCPVDLTSFDSYFMQAPYWWPGGSIGQP